MRNSSDEQRWHVKDQDELLVIGVQGLIINAGNVRPLASGTDG